MKEIKFDGKLMQFKKNENKPDKSLLGLLVNKQLCDSFENMKEVKINSQIIQNYHSHFHLFKLENDSNVAL